MVREFSGEPGVVWEFNGGPGDGRETPKNIIFWSWCGNSFASGLAGIYIFLLYMISSSYLENRLNCFLLTYFFSEKHLPKTAPFAFWRNKSEKIKGTRASPQGLRNLNKQCSSSPAFTYDGRGFFSFILVIPTFPYLSLLWGSSQDL